MANDLLKEAETLVASIPAEMTPASLIVIGELRRRLHAARQEIGDTNEEIGELAASRGCADDEPAVGYLTAAERARWEQCQRRALDAERAQAVLMAWDRRSGVANLLESMTGEPYPESPETMAENPEGGVMFRVRDDPVEDD